MVGYTARGGGGEATRALRAGEDVSMARGRWASESGGESVAREEAELPAGIITLAEIVSDSSPFEMNR